MHYSGVPLLELRLPSFGPPAPGPAPISWAAPIHSKTRFFANLDNRQGPKSMQKNALTSGSSQVSQAVRCEALNYMAAWSHQPIASQIA